MRKQNSEQRRFSLGGVRAGSTKGVETLKLELEVGDIEYWVGCGILGANLDLLCNASCKNDEEIYLPSGG